MEDFLKNYKIGRNGDVINIKTNRILRKDFSSTYPAITLSNNGKTKRFSIHRLLALVHLPNPENKPCVNHKDGNKLNFDLNNLEWVTYQENVIHSFKELGKSVVHSKETKIKIGNANRGLVRSKDLINNMSLKRKGLPAKNRIKVNLNGEEFFDSMKQAAQLKGISVSAIRQNIIGRTKKTLVGIWKLT